MVLFVFWIFLCAARSEACKDGEASDTSGCFFFLISFALSSVIFFLPLCDNFIMNIGLKAMLILPMLYWSIF